MNFKANIPSATSVKILAITAMLAGCTASMPEWTAEDTLAHAQNQAHHWGQKGEASPNNGWSDYTAMTVDFGAGAPAYTVLKQSEGAISIMVYDKQSDKVEFRAISIPGAGIFILSGDKEDCSPDQIERLGLHAELVLHDLALAFPAGPAHTTLASSNPISIDVKPTTLHFMQAVAMMQTSQKHTVRIESATPNKYVFSVNYGSNTEIAKVQWEKQGAEPVVQDNESLEGWSTCWAGTYSFKPDGKKSFVLNIKNTDSLKTFGDIRRSLNPPLPASAKEG